MKTFHCLIAGLRLAFSNAASRNAIPLLVVGLALVFVQPCAALSFQFEETGSMAVARENGKAERLRNGRVLVEGGGTATAALSRARNSTIQRATLGRPRAASPAARYSSHGYLAARRQGARRRRHSRHVRERGTLRSGYRDVVRYWQPQ